jgi:hypothetical protein
MSCKICHRELVSVCLCSTMTCSICDMYEEYTTKGSTHVGHDPTCPDIKGCTICKNGIYSICSKCNRDMCEVCTHDCPAELTDINVIMKTPMSLLEYARYWHKNNGKS